MERIQKKISIIVPAYKVEKYVIRCIDSIINQTHTEYELILIDDGSPDLSSSICDYYAEKDKRITVIHQQNGGLSDARNKGIDLAVGEWITFIDGDDWIHPKYLEALYRAVIVSNLSISIGSYESVKDETTVKNDSLVSDAILVKPEDYWVEHRVNATVAWGKIYKRELFYSIRYPVGKYHEDEYVTYKLLFQQERIAVIETPIYRYFYNDGSISRMNYMKRFPDILESYIMHYDFFRNSLYTKAFRLETELYAECLSIAVNASRYNKRQTAIYRKYLKAFLKENKKMIPFERRKDIYIAAYPRQKLFIRGFGFLKQVVNGERGWKKESTIKI